MNVASAKHSSQTKRPRWSNSLNSTRQASSSTSWSAQSCSRRQQVLAEGYPLGNAFHAAPYRNIHRMPSKQCRLSIGVCPPRAERIGSGNSRASFAHCSSVNIGSYDAAYALAIERTPFNDH
jgi:hypothetical protein